MLNIFFSPTRRFQSLAQKPEWVVPLILLLILPLIISTIAVTVLPRAVLINAIEERISRTKEFIDQQIEKGRMPQAQREVAIQRIEEAFRTELEFYRNSSKFALFFRFLLRSLSAVIWSGVRNDSQPPPSPTWHRFQFRPYLCHRRQLRLSAPTNRAISCPFNACYQQNHRCH